MILIFILLVLFRSFHILFRPFVVFILFFLLQKYLFRPNSFSTFVTPDTPDRFALAFHLRLHLRFYLRFHLDRPDELCSFN